MLIRERVVTAEVRVVRPVEAPLRLEVILRLLLNPYPRRRLIRYIIRVFVLIIRNKDITLRIILIRLKAL